MAQGISPQLLEWKGIEATENLAKSTNSKVVVIGNSKNGSAADSGSITRPWAGRPQDCRRDAGAT